MPTLNQITIEGQELFASGVSLIENWKLEADLTWDKKLDIGFEKRLSKLEESPDNWFGPWMAICALCCFSFPLTAGSLSKHHILGITTQWWYGCIGALIMVFLIARYHLCTYLPNKIEKARLELKEAKQENNKNKANDPLYKQASKLYVAWGQFISTITYYTFRVEKSRYEVPQSLLDEFESIMGLFRRDIEHFMNVVRIIRERDKLLGSSKTLRTLQKNGFEEYLEEKGLSTGSEIEPLEILFDVELLLQDPGILGEIEESLAVAQEENDLSRRIEEAAAEAATSKISVITEEVVEVYVDHA